jgi:adenylyltransferase/sulfurtransferase
MLSASERARYSRHLSLPEIGAAGQEKLAAARVLVVGAGGLGCPAALYLAAAGIGRLGLVDADRVDMSNLQRQILYATNDVGRRKVEAAAERLRALNPGIEVVAHDMEVRARNALELLTDYDVIIDGTDRINTRYVVNDACVLLGKPLVSAAIYRFEGQAFTYVPNAGPCYRCIFPDASGGGAPSCADAGVLGVLPGILGTLQAAEAIKLVAGVGEPLVGRLLTFDALEMRFQTFAVARDDACAVCGLEPAITELREREDTEPHGASVQRLQPEALDAMLRTADPANPRLLLIDVREPHEFARGHLSGAASIPLAELPGKLAALDRAALPVFICRSGARSLRACSLAAEAGFGTVAQLEGGLLGWAAAVDPDFDL